MALATRTLRSLQRFNKNVLLVSGRRRHDGCSPLLLKSSSRPYSDTVGVKLTGSNVTSSDKKDPAQFFFKDEVQSCLLEMNMRDTSKVFEPRKEGKTLSEPELKFLTQEELDEELERAHEVARYYLQLPPVLSPKPDERIVLSEDPELQGLEESKILVTDISFGVPHRDRIIVARDTDGTLRHASRDERYRMLQTYFPEEGRAIEPPQLFTSEKLKSLLDRLEYQFVLDKACIQFEPDDPQYVSVTSITYDHIDASGEYDLLVGTRHYGSMAFYLVFNGRQDKFLKHCISTHKIQDAVALTKVFYLTRPEITDYSNPSSPDDTAFLKEYISKYAKDKASLTMTLNAHLELQLPTADEERTLSGNQ